MTTQRIDVDLDTMEGSRQTFKNECDSVDEIVCPYCGITFDYHVDIAECKDHDEFEEMCPKCEAEFKVEIERDDIYYFKSKPLED